MNFLKNLFKKSPAPSDTSPAGTIDKNDWKSLVVTALLVGASAILTYFVDNASSINFGEYNSVIGPVIFMILKTAQKWLKDNTTTA